MEAKEARADVPLSDSELGEWEVRTQQNGDWSSAEVSRLIAEIRRLRNEAMMAKAGEAIRALAMQDAPRPVDRDSWRKTIGMFRDDPGFERLLDAGQRIRESEYE
jgi:hypothetical protein